MKIIDKIFNDNKKYYGDDLINPTKIFNNGDWKYPDLVKDSWIELENNFVFEMEFKIETYKKTTQNATTTLRLVDQDTNYGYDMFNLNDINELFRRIHSGEITMNDNHNFVGQFVVIKTYYYTVKPL